MNSSVQKWCGFLLAGLAFFGVALALEPGDKPALPKQLTDSYGKTIALETNRWKVFYFYPRVGTSGCTTQNIEYTKLYPQFLEAKVQVFGVSSDDAKAQCAFIEGQKLKIPQIPNAEPTLGRLFEVGSIVGMLMRNTYIVGPDGRLRAVREGVNPVSDASEVLEFIKRGGDCKVFSSGKNRCSS
jgi:thioredoxin-dependent peroxiredoxin